MGNEKRWSINALRQEIWEAEQKMDKLSPSDALRFGYSKDQGRYYVMFEGETIGQDLPIQAACSLVQGISLGIDKASKHNPLIDANGNKAFSPASAIYRGRVYHFSGQADVCPDGSVDVSLSGWGEEPLWVPAHEVIFTKDNEGAIDALLAQGKEAGQMSYEDVLSVVQLLKDNKDES